MLKKIHIVSLSLGSCILILASCGKKDPNSPGVEFMPDMYRSPSIEVYNANPMYDDSTGSRKPVEGTIPRGFMPYLFSNDSTGYGLAGRTLKNPIALTPEILAEGELLYGTFCAQCHGADGGGDGLVAAKLPGAPPAYYGSLKNLPEGKMFHSITYGKGLMGAHAQQLSQEERWKIVHFVQKLQHSKDVVEVAATAEVSKVIEEKKN